MQPISRSGAGIAQIMYICARILETSSDINAGLKFAIFDEPETGLHAGLQTSLTHLMRELSQLYDVQWLFGSHSPFIFRAVDSSIGDKLWNITHNGEQSQVRLVNHTNSILELYNSIGLHLPLILTAKAVVFCEGLSELHFLPKALRKAGIDVTNVVFVPLGGIGNFKHISPEDLHLLHPNCMLILDWDKGDSENIMIDKLFMDSGIKVYCNSEYRTLENSYSPKAYAKVYQCESIPLIGPFDEADSIKQKLRDAGCKIQLARKAKLADKIVEAMTDLECREHPLIKDVNEWLQSI